VLLDEHYSAEIADQLRQRGFDAVAINERRELKGAGDQDVWEVARTEQRALISNNVKDFMPIYSRDREDGRDNFGLILTSDRGMPRNRNTIGVYVDALERFLVERPRIDDLLNHVHWLSQ
jgi:Domain of unknown function (DUF5615)